MVCAVHQCYIDLRVFFCFVLFCRVNAYPCSVHSRSPDLTPESGQRAKGVAFFGEGP
jgi:hypothetical protein